MWKPDLGDYRAIQTAVVHGAPQRCNGGRYPSIFVRIDNDQALTWIKDIAFSKQSTIPTTKDTQTQPQCPTDDLQYGLMDDGRCVYFEIARLTYEEAIKNCHEKLETFGGGVLYEPNSTHELKRIMKMGYDGGSTISKGVWWWWIGVNDIANEGQFTYNSSNQTINFNPDWYPSFGSKGPSDNCVTIVV